MWQYLIRRFLYVLPILIGVNIITFMLFFFINTPNDIARIHLGNKYVTQEAMEQWKEVHGYHLPLLYNNKEKGLRTFTKTIFFEKSLKLFVFEFGLSDNGRDIGQAIRERALPSLSIAVPSLIVSVFFNILLAMIFVLFKDSVFDLIGIFVCVVLISISSLFFIVGGQYLFAKYLLWFPISGYVSGLWSVKFLILPILISVWVGIGGGVRWYRSLFIEELNKDYVRTARAKGLSEFAALFRHVLPNALIPILTGIVVILPLLFMGSLLMESFFSIPGLGSYTIDAIREQDFAIVRAMVFLGTVLYMLGLLLTDLSYVWADPRVRLQ